MKRVFLALLFLLGITHIVTSHTVAQDTLISFDDVEFTDGEDTTESTYMEVPDDVAFTDGQDTTAHATASTADANNAAGDENPQTLWGIFIAGIIGGFAAFLMPCIYPMVPLTVSFFTKQSGTRTKGIVNALLYGLFIIVIYVALGMLVTLLFGASALNEAASSAWFNLLFFIIIVIFAISFLGAFEITLPSRFVNKMDEKSNRGGLLGLFFMAFTLALVSFSCTGPIIGYLLVEAVSKGALLGPAMGMLGFSVALAIPFMLFAFFPSLLKEMPKSGGWLNTVKVSLGFLELALAFKFLSNVDLAYHWRILDREVFLSIWIVIFGLFGLYLLGKLKFSHDSDVPFISIPRLFFAIAILSFTVYMVPGLWGAPLKALSAWLPPSPTQDFNLHQAGLVGATPQASAGIVKKYGDIFHAPHGIDAFYDYEQALEYSKQVGKPVLLDFTGWSCVNCRKMEESVWPDPQVLKLLKEAYILASLYVDDRTKLEPHEQYVSGFSGKQINTVGRKWSDLQQSRFGVNAQPYYVIVDSEGNQLVPAQAYKEDIPNYLNFLNSGLEAFKRP
ncbi:protein-disulfide reductase DsbD family protein [Parapedobacter koreensis]|uniref:Thiol:disulfide interchange protein DsbD n=1 Tax=Parapedobacter koreensis TaxID=332977 RepID=A0A1H7QEA1_9SPHI|nr:thioredoxin family protein [Parapedobacter koreensis]SEL45835.1 thiol:disulfide interchange protein DsbD [Parapedobacter koreensis]